jgi:hypothetical protein
MKLIMDVLSFMLNTKQSYANTLRQNKDGTLD